MCKSKRPSTPPTPLTVLSINLVYWKSHELLRQLACGANWKPVAELREALATYAELRQINIIQAAQDDDPQCVQLNDPPAPVTERSTHHA